SSKVGAVCGSAASTDLCGGRPAMVVPTATRTELVWKSDIWFGDKAVGLKATVVGVIHYCQLGKLDSNGKQRRIASIVFTRLRRVLVIRQGSLGTYRW